MTAAHDTQALARAFHDAHERLAPSFGYETRKEKGEFDPLSPNGMLIIAVMETLASRLQEQEGQPAAFLVTNLRSGEPSLCFEDERGDYGDEEHAPVFTPLFAGSQAVQVPGWRPIDSAPKDATLLLSDGYTVGEGFWHDGSQCHGHRGGAGWFWESDRGDLLIASNAGATHWQPLPPPPLQPLAGGEVGK